MVHGHARFRQDWPLVHGEWITDDSHVLRLQNPEHATVLVQGLLRLRHAEVHQTWKSSICINNIMFGFRCDKSLLVF